MEKQDTEKHYTLIEHLEELRLTFIRILVWIAILFPVCYYFSMPAILGLKGMCPQLKELIYIKPLDLFFTRMKVAFILSLVVGFPYVAYQVWKFVSPALFKEERYYVSRFVLASTSLFIIGAVFSLFAIFPAVLRFATEMGTDDIVPRLEVTGLINLAGMLIVGFGLVFQLPIFVYVFARTGILSVETMARNRPIVITVIFIVSALFTPPDVVSQLAMAIPTLVLFEGSLLFAKFAVRKNEKNE